MQRFYSNTTIQNGIPPGASVSIYTYTGVLATIYAASDPLLDPITPTSNPLTADAFGVFSFAAPDGNYIAKITSGKYNDTVSGIVLATAPPSSITPTSISYTATGGSVTRTVQLALDEMYVNVLSFGADPTGATDSTTAFNAAIAYAASSNIRRVFIPGGRFAVNCLINVDDITLFSHGGKDINGDDTASELVPWTNANPVIQIGNDTKLVVGWHIRDITMSGAGPNGTGTTGLSIQGGAQDGSIENFSAEYFSAYCIKFGVGPSLTPTYPIQYIDCVNIHLSMNQVGAMTAALGMYNGNATTAWVSAVYWHNLHIQGSSYAGYAIESDGCGVWIFGGWCQVHSGGGVHLTNSYGNSTPGLYGMCNFEISGGTEFLYVPTLDAYGSAWVKGMIYTTSGAQIKTSDLILHNFNQGTGLTANAEGYNFHALDNLYFTSHNIDATETSVYIANSNGTGHLNLVTNKGTANMVSIRNDGGIQHSANGGYVWQAIAVATGVNYLTLTNATTGNPAKLSAVGETNTALSLLPNGTGSVNVKNALNMTTVGYGLQVKEGANGKQGTATLVAGTVTVANTSVTANSRIFLTGQALNASTAIGDLNVTARVVGTSFTITAITAGAVTTQTGDLRTVAWEIFEPGV